MRDEVLLKKKQVACEGCGAPLYLSEDTKTIVCKFCGLIYEYYPTIKTIPYLIFDRQDRPPFRYELTGDVIIGREQIKGYIQIKSEVNEAIVENTFIRNPFVSGKHAKIRVKEEYIILKEGNVRKVVEKKKCFIEDLASKRGTMVNNILLNPTDLKEIKHNDQIMLAPNSSLPLVMTFKETPQ